MKNEKKHTNSASPNTRGKILDAALTEFAEFGLAGSRVDRIAERAGVNKAMIYYHFSSKEELYQKVIEEHMLKMLEKGIQAFTGGSSVEEILENFAEMYVQAFSQKPEFVKILLRELADPQTSIVEKTAEMIAGMGVQQQITTAFQVGVAAGVLRKVDVRQTFVSFVLMNVGYFILSPLIDKIWNITDRGSFIAERKKAVVDLFLHGVKSR